MKKSKYPGCWYCDNIVDHPETFGLLHLGFPRCFILIKDMAAFDSSDYDEFRDAIADVQWLDPSEQWSEADKEAGIVKLWNFSVEQEALDEEGYYDALIDAGLD